MSWQTLVRPGGRPWALDLFCGGGGAALGLIAAGFDVLGVDVDAKCAAVYPGRAFLRADYRDAVEMLQPLSRFALVWASPPCQRWSNAQNLSHMKRRKGERLDHVRPTRELIGGHRRSVIENVPNAPIRGDVRLTGPAVGLPRLWRLRHFETSWGVRQIVQPPRPAGSVAEGTLVTVTRQGGIAGRNIRARRRELRPDLSPDRFHRDEMAAAMGLPEDTRLTMAQIGEAVPPAYARFVAELALREGPAAIVREFR